MMRTLGKTDSHGLRSLSDEESKLNAALEESLIPLTDGEIEAVAGGCVLVEPGPKGEPVPVPN
jgi:hypothetical protein